MAELTAMAKLKIPQWRRDPEATEARSILARGAPLHEPAAPNRIGRAERFGHIREDLGEAVLQFNEGEIARETGSDRSVRRRSLARLARRAGRPGSCGTVRC